MTKVQGRKGLTLSDLTQFLDGANYAVVGGKRVVQKDGRSIPLESIVQSIYANRPNLFCAADRKVEPYMNAAKKFQQLLPKESDNKSLLQEITDCFWSCYCPIQIYWCTVSQRERVVVADAKLGMEGLRDWKQASGEHMYG